MAAIALKQLEKGFTDDIARGVYSVGDILPSLREVAARYDVQLPLCNRFYGILKDRGLIVSVPRKGMVLANGACDSALPNILLKRKGILVAGLLQTENMMAKYNSASQCLNVIEGECLDNGIPMFFYNFHRKSDESLPFPFPGELRLDAGHIADINHYEAAGVIVISEFKRDEADAGKLLAGISAPAVAIGECPGIAPDILPDEFEAGRKAATHLLELGHRKIVFIAYDADFQWLRERIAGCQKALKEYGVPPAAITRISYDKSYPLDSIREGLYSELPRMHGKFTAALCCTDKVGQILLEFESENGISLEKGLSFITFDDDWDLRPLDMTSVRRPAEVQAKAAFKMLVKKIVMPDSVPETVKVVANLYVRSSARSIDSKRRGCD